MKWYRKYDYEILLLIIYPIGVYVGYIQAEDTYLSWDALIQAAISLSILVLVMVILRWVRNGE